jgi:hypothetical protein
MMRRFEFNAIYVIESLPSGETATGTQLYDDIIRRWTMKISYLKSFLVTVSTKQEFLAALDVICAGTTASPQLSPYIHFEIHGNKEGFVLRSGEPVTWEELAAALRAINIRLKNNLFISLATCYGAYIASGILPSQPAPFFGLIGSAEKLDEGDIMQSFQTFFDFMLNESNLQHIDFNKGVAILNQSLTPPRRYYFITAEQVFEMLVEEHENNLWKPGGMSKRVKELMADYRIIEKVKKISNSQLKKLTESEFIRQRHSIQENMRNSFLMKC